MDKTQSRVNDVNNSTLSSRRRKKKKLLLTIAALATFPISIPYLGVKAIRKKLSKARTARKIKALDNLNVSQDSDAAQNSPLLSIIVPVYNIAPYLEASIVAVLNQSYRNIEVLIVDDGSTDDSLMVAKMFEKIDPRVRVIDLPYNTLGGAGIPSNIGLEHATGEYIGFVDGDDILKGFSFDTLMHRARSFNSDLTIGYFKTFLDDTREISEPYDRTVWSDLPKEKVLAPDECPKSLMISAVPWRKIYKKAFLDKHNIMFPEGDLFYEDNPLHWAAMSAAESIVFVDVTVSFHRMNRPGQTMASASPKLAAFFQHITAISQSIRKNDAKFAWPQFLDYVEKTRWVMDRQVDERFAEQFRLRFIQVIEEHVAPFLSSQQDRALRKLYNCFKTQLEPADLSIVVFHDAKSATDADLEHTIASIGQLTSRTETILLHDATQPVSTNPEEILHVPTRANVCRSYNQAIELCSGRYIVFLKSGDAFVPSMVDEAVRNDNPAADILRCSPLPEDDILSVVPSLYSRVMVQNNAIFFGPTEFGVWSFDQLTALYASEIMNLSGDAIVRNQRSMRSIDFEEVANEAGYLVRKAFRSAPTEQAGQSILTAISDLFKQTEMAVTTDEKAQHESAKQYISGQIDAAMDRQNKN